MRGLLPCLAALYLVAAPAAWAGPPPVHASAFIVESGQTGQVLAASGAHRRLPIASITKLMTVHLALEHHRLSDVVTVDPRAAAVGESTANLDAGDRLTVADLIRAALIQSANDAADALALSVAPSYDDFAKLMNRSAARLGLHDSHFVRPDGLDAPGEYSSARDVTRLAEIAMHNPVIRDAVRRTTAEISGGRILHTWNDLLTSFPHLIGVKTGHTGAAGWCQVAAVRGPGGVVVYATLLGSPARAVRDADLASLLVWGQAQFRVVPLVQAGRVYARVALPYGEHDLDLVAAHPLRAAVLVDRPLRERVVAARSVKLPVRQGAPLGRVEVWAGDRLIGHSELVAARTVDRPGVLRRLGWYAGRTAHHLADLISP